MINIAKLFESSKVRVLSLLVIIVVIIIAVIVYFRWDSSEKQSAHVAVKGLTETVATVPGSQHLSKQYLNLLLQANKTAAQQAMKRGRSAIPTIINVGRGGAAAGTALTAGQNCDAIRACCGCDGETTDSLIDNLLQKGQLSPIVAAQLKKLAASGASVSDYAAALNKLVKEGKLTPEQARRLLAAYEREHAKLTAGQLLDQMVAGGALPPDVAKQLHDLSDTGASVDDYAAKLNQLVKEGKLTPEQAKRLLAAYKKTHRKVTSQGLLNQMMASGAVSPEVASQLQGLAKSGASVGDYKAALDKLVKEGKLTPEQEKQLLAAYRREHGMSTAQHANSLVDQLASNGAISPEAASELKSLADKAPTVGDYAAELNRMVKEGKITPEQAKRLLAEYRREHGGSNVASQAGRLGSQLASTGQISPEAAADLKKLSSKGVPAAQYAAELNRLVKEGKLTPAQAQKLLEAYKKEHGATSVAAGEKAGMTRQQQATVLKEEEQALQARLAKQQAAAAAGVAQATVTTAATQAQVTAMQANVKKQAQALLSSWHPTKQQYKEMPKQKKGAGPGGVGVPGSEGTAAAGQSQAAAQSAAGITAPMIKAGTIMFAVLDTAVNSDQQGPVMATMVNGPYKGAKLLGQFQSTTDSERVILSFSTMSMKNWVQNVKIDAVAINPDTAHTAIASDVDHHYLLKWGSLFASNFLAGYASAITTAGATTTNNAGTSTTAHPDLSPRDKMLVGLGKVGEKVSDWAGKEMDRKPTVTVDAGAGIGVLFTNDVKKPGFLSTQAETK